MTPRIGACFVGWPSAPDDRTLGVVDFSIFPHLDAFPTNTLADAERWAAEIGVPAYAIDEQTAIKVVGVSEGGIIANTWHCWHLTGSPPSPCSASRAPPRSRR
jgi:dipeptidase E